MKPLGAIMAVVGYARVSSVGQSLEVQLEKLKACDKLFQEKRSGTSNQRSRLQACLEYVREGDTLVVTRLDRLARSTLHLCQLAEQLARKQVNLQVLDQNIHTGDATGRLLFNMLGAIAQFETEIRAERQRDGIQNAKARGVRLGRKKDLTEQECLALRQQRAQGALIKTLMKDYKLSKASVYRYLDGVKVVQPAI
jgi:DNA invertase Pin-like site-specific DNA recombinase